MLDKIKKFHQDRTIKQLVSYPRYKRISNISQVMEIGIVFTVGAEKEWNLIYELAKEWEKEGKSVKMIGLIHKGMELDYIFTHQGCSIVREDSEINFWGIPKEESVSAFIQQRYDLLIDASVDQEFFSRYVAVKALADLKVNYLDMDDEEAVENPQIYDLTIRGNGPLELKRYFTDIVRYLQMIKK